MSFDYQAAPTEKSNTQQRPRQQLGSACDECRRRKLRCDRKKPQCNACANSGVQCVTRDESSPRGPKKGHVSALRNKIAYLEARLSEREATTSENRGQGPNLDNDGQSSNEHSTNGQSTNGDSLPLPPLVSSAQTTDFNAISAWFTTTNTQLMPTSRNDSVDDTFSNFIFPPLDQLPIGAHLSPLVCSDLDQLYFDRVHAFAPMVHKVRYHSWARQLDKSKQKICLQYAMWTVAASLSSQFQMIRHELYTEVRRLLDAVELENQDISLVCIEQPQAWLLLSMYELITDQFHRCLVSAGRAFRLIQLMRLHEIDRHSQMGLRGDWVDEESMRRTFWIAYQLDRFTSVVDGLSLSFDEREISTRLPAPDSNFTNEQPTVMCFLAEAVSGMDSGRPSGALSPFAESVILATICGRALNLKQQPLAEYGNHIPVQEFYRKHQAIQALLVTRCQILLRQITSTQGHPNPMLVFLAISANMVNFILCENLESAHLGGESPEAEVNANKQRSLDGANEMRMLLPVLGQLNQFETHPFTPIPLLFVARYCLSHMGLDESYGGLLPAIATSLRTLSNVNGLAQKFLQVLDLNMPNSF